MGEDNENAAQLSGVLFYRQCVRLQRVSAVEALCDSVECVRVPEPVLAGFPTSDRPNRRAALQLISCLQATPCLSPIDSRRYIPVDS